VVFFSIQRRKPLFLCVFCIFLPPTSLFLLLFFFMMMLLSGLTGRNGGGHGGSYADSSQWFFFSSPLFLCWFFFFVLSLSFHPQNPPICSSLSHQISTPLSLLVPPLVFISRGGEDHLTPTMVQGKVGDGSCWQGMMVEAWVSWFSSSWQHRLIGMGFGRVYASGRERK